MVLMGYNGTKTIEKGAKLIKEKLAKPMSVVELARKTKEKREGKTAKTITSKDLGGKTGTTRQPKYSDFPDTPKGYNDYIKALKNWNQRQKTIKKKK